MVVQDRTAVLPEWSQNRFMYSHGADSKRIVEDKTAVFAVVPGKVYSLGAVS